MNTRIWQSVDAFVEQSMLPADPVLDAVLAANQEAGLPPIDVSRAQGALLNIFARMCGARRILEIGTLGGYSTIWMARALPADGKVVTLEADPHHAETARANFDRAGLADKVELRVGSALETLPELTGEGAEPFDMVFIDADKPSNRQYIEWAFSLGRSGTVIICDNVVRDGDVADAASDDPNVTGARDAITILGTSDCAATAVQTVGSKGYDGFAVAVMN